ncbi:TPA: ABC transporter ATP-binding protein [Clostridium sporogenes]
MSIKGLGYTKFYKKTNEKPHITKELISRILKYFLNYWKLMIILCITIIMTSILEVIPPILAKNIIDIALPNEDLNLLLRYILIAFGILLVINLILVGQGYLNSVISKSIIRDLRTTMYSNLQNMPIKFFFDVHTGEITSRINNDIGGIESVFANIFIKFLRNIFIFMATAAMLFYTNWRLAIVAFIMLPLFILPTKKVGKIRWKIATKTQQKFSELTSIITETLNVNGAILIKLFTQEKDKSREFEDVNNEVTRLQIRESVVGRWFFMTLQTFVGIIPMTIYLLGGLLMIRYHDITIGGIVMFVTLINRLYEPVTTFSNIHVDIVRSMALFERIFQYIDLKSDIIEKSDAINVDSIKGEIRFQNVQFSYNSKSLALSDVDFVIKPGQMAAFVGPSGAGKTTITYLVPRLYDASEGAVLIDGMNIKDIGIKSLRNQIGMVTQDTFLFNTTIRENLLFARRDAKEKDIIAACKMANIHDSIIALPDGYDTVVGEAGIKLSGGEKQRISIARTLLKNPKIVIFDEATAALDSNSEGVIQKAIQPLLKSRTSLVIAHRLSTIISADVIYVVKDGKIVERGTHGELLNVAGVYKELYDKQFKPLENHEHITSI